MLLALSAAASVATAQTPDSLATAPVPSRILEHVDNAHLSRLAGNTHPMARPEFDRGLLQPTQPLNRLMLVLKRSPEQEAALAAFNQRQYDPKSPDYHHWLEPEEFGRLFGPSDADVTAITSWLQNQGFQVNNVSKGRVTVEFSGTVAQLQSAFHLEMHNYLVDGKMHISNDRDPQIPAALAPVVTGIASLNDFRPRHFDHPGNYVKRDLKTGKYSLVEPEPKPAPIAGANAQPGALKINPNAAPIAKPDFGYVDGNNYIREELSPYDVAAIYNILPLWNASTPINGTGVKVAIIGLSDVQASDVATFRSTFGLPAKAFTTAHSGSDPGYTDSQGENTEDVEMVSTTAPGASIVMVADVSNQTTDGLATAIDYVVNNNIAPILTMSYGACELNLGSSGNSFYNQLFQQAATQGVSSFVASGDSGSTVCTGQNGQPPYA
ncbi:MAG TPA: protease pro-enzyme activation domain-containing protein, partial [Acidobacteriaceae bacterium]